VVEEICPACNGTGFLPVIRQPAPGKGFTIRAARSAAVRATHPDRERFEQAGWPPGKVD
jgi:hypothetical protein